MGFIQANILFFKRYFDFKGRSTRPEIWWPFLLWWLVVIILLIAIGIVDQDMPEDEFSPAGGFLASFVGIWYLLTIIPGIAVRVRRFHDQDKTGWMYLWRLFPLGGGLIIIIYMCLDGTKGRNRFGDDSLGAGVGETFD